MTKIAVFISYQHYGEREKMHQNSEIFGRWTKCKCIFISIFCVYLKLDKSDIT